MSTDVVSVGRISVDLYAQEPHAGFADQQSLRSLGVEAPPMWR